MNTTSITASRFFIPGIFVIVLVSFLVTLGIDNTWLRLVVMLVLALVGGGGLKALIEQDDKRRNQRSRADAEMER